MNFTNSMWPRKSEILFQANWSEKKTQNYDSWAAEETSIPPYINLGATMGNKKLLENQLKPDLQSFKGTCSRATRSLTLQQAEGWSQILSLNRADTVFGLPTPLEALTDLSYCQGFCEKNNVL